MTRLVALIPAAGRSERAGSGTAKQFRNIAGRSVLSHTLAAVIADTRVSAVMMVLPPDAGWPNDLDLAGLDLLACPGGETRADSVLAGLHAVAGRFPGTGHVLVHDAARPCLHPHDLGAVIDAGLAGDDGAILARKVTDTVKRGGERIDSTVEREQLWLAQTPQVFSIHALLDALEAAGEVTDEAAAMEQAGFRPRLVAARYPNPKITWPEDLALAEVLLGARDQGPGTRDQ